MTKKKASTKSAAKKASKKKASTKRAAKKASKSESAKKSAATAKKNATKSGSQKSASKKGTAKKGLSKRKKSAPKKSAPKKSAPKKSAPKKNTAKKSAPKARATKTRSKSNRTNQALVDASLFRPLSEGEHAEALRVLIEDPRLSTMANIGRYRVITVEPLAVKPPHPLAGRRLARLVIYDYAADRSVDGCVDLDNNRVTHLNVTRAQPMLAREEEAAAISIALADERVKDQLTLGEEPRVAMHYWSHRDTSLSYSRRSAAVIFGRPDSRPSLVAVVDLLDDLVCEIVPATQW